MLIENAYNPKTDPDQGKKKAKGKEFIKEKRQTV